MPRATTVSVVDSKALAEGGQEAPEDPEAIPRTVQAFVVERDPKMMVIPNFFTEAECQHLLELVEGYWMPSLVGRATYVDGEDYGEKAMKNTLSQTRTSWSCMLRYSQTGIVERLEHRLASAAGLPVAQLERMNMVRYAPGELFNEHHDGKFRPKTVFVYLNELPEDEDAGDTFFPVLGLSFKPRRGTAVVWSNVLDGCDDSGAPLEDKRMLHAGRAPSRSVKYGVNCFFHNKHVRRLASAPGPDALAADAAEVVVAELGSGSKDEPPSGDIDSECFGADVRDAKSNDESGADATRETAATSKASNIDPAVQKVMTLFSLCQSPKLIAVPAFLDTAESRYFMDFLSRATAVPAPPVFRGGTQTLCTISDPDSPVLQAVEHRLAAAGGLAVNHLASLRVVRPGTRGERCNRGCGPKSGYICLGESDEVLFPRLGMRLLLRSGDMLMWPNSAATSGELLEDVRTVRCHLQPDAIGLDVFFHDNPLREQQAMREFVPDSEFASAAGA